MDFDLQKTQNPQAQGQTDRSFPEGRIPIGLSPLAGVSDRPFRSLCFAMGADFAVAEMVSASGLYYDSERTQLLLNTDPSENHILCQIFGKDPQIMEKVIREKLNLRSEFVGIDLNMGCPAPKIVKNGEGSALMKDPILAGKVIGAMVKASSKPVSVKFRLGWDEGHQNYLEIGKIAQEEGASHVTLHGRTTCQQYSGSANWEAIARLKDALTIPVIGNGDVNSPQSAQAMISETHCDGIAIGRGAMGNPFLFREIRQAMKGEKVVHPTARERFQVIQEHYEQEIAMRGQHAAILFMRKNLAWYIAGLKGAAKARTELMQTEDLSEIRSILSLLFS